MSDTRRRILELVAEGRLSPPEAARLLGDPAAGEVLSVVLDEPMPGMTIARLEVTGTGGQVTIVGDESVSDIEVDGPHTLRHEDDAAVVEFSGSGQQFFNVQGGMVLGAISRGERGAVGGLTSAGGAHTHSQTVPLVIRANPSLPLAVSVTAGGLTVEGMTGPIRCESISSVSSIRDIVGPINALINAGSLNAEGWFREGESRIECAMGLLRIGLRPDADMRLQINEVLGRVRVDLPEDDDFKPVKSSAGQDPETQHVFYKEWEIGQGTGSLSVDANMARVVVMQAHPQADAITQVFGGQLSRHQVVQALPGQIHLERSEGAADTDDHNETETDDNNPDADSE